MTEFVCGKDKGPAFSGVEGWISRVLCIHSLLVNFKSKRGN